MSYPSIVPILEERRIDLETATDSQLKGALWQALQTDLGAGVDYLKQVAAEVKGTGQRTLKVEDPNSPLGKQVIRLLGTDVARRMCEEQFGVAFGFYNCCAPVVAPTREMLNLSLREQIELQNGVLASADC